MMLGCVVTQPYYVGDRISCSDLGILAGQFQNGSFKFEIKLSHCLACCTGRTWGMELKG
jgi:hypothetical protein